jgi:cytochrome c peroxidase
MHDGAIPNIELQPIAPIQNTIEMGENIVNVIGKLRATTKYQELFKNAYGSNEVNSQKMFKSMAQFMALMYSYRSKYDRYKRREEGGNFSDAELRGYNLFIAKCASCHKEPLFTDFVLRNNGLAIDPSLNDLGRAAITGLDGDRYKFKTPSLRNIALTGPYMHDGSLKTLEACIDHYTNGIINLTNLDPLIPTNGLQISAEEKQDIVSFLHTLTDYEFIADKRFSNPNAR